MPDFQWVAAHLTAGRRHPMRVVIELSMDPNGVLHGTATWAGSESATFHGTLELVAVVERAAGRGEDPDRAEPQQPINEG